MQEFGGCNVAGSAEHSRIWSAGIQSYEAYLQASQASLLLIMTPACTSAAGSVWCVHLSMVCGPLPHRRWAGAVGGGLRRGGSAVQGAAGRIRVPALWHRGRDVRLAAQLSLRQRSMSILQHPSVRRLRGREVRISTPFLPAPNCSANPPPLPALCWVLLALMSTFQMHETVAARGPVHNPQALPAA